MNEVGLPDSSVEGAKPIREWPVRIGGLMRCCTETLRVDAGYAKEGQVLACFYCQSSMRLRDGAWEWEPMTVEHRPHDDPCCGCVSRLRAQNHASAIKADARVGELERQLARIKATADFASRYFAARAEPGGYNPWHMTSEVIRYAFIDLLTRLEDAGLPLPDIDPAAIKRANV